MIRRLYRAIVPDGALCIRAFICNADLRAVMSPPLTGPEWDAAWLAAPRRFWIKSPR